MTAREFWQWFEGEMTRRGFRSVRQVERAGGVGNDTISGRHRAQREPTDTIIRAIAEAFQMTFEDVERIASGEAISRPESLDSASLTLRELWDIVSELPVQEQRAVLDYALYRRSRSEQVADDATPNAPSASQQSPAASDGGG